MPVKVYAQKNTLITSGLFHLGSTGHVAMEVSGPGINTFYISWYPNNAVITQYQLWIRKGRVSAARTMASRGVNRVEPVPSFLDEHYAFRNAFSQGPIEIPVMGECPDCPGVGLNAQRIKQWWEMARKNITAYFSLISKSKNCAGTVMSALWAGGADTYASYTRITWVTPRDVYGYANDLKQNIENAATLCRRAQDLINSGKSRNELTRSQRKIVDRADTKENNKEEIYDLDFGRTTNTLGQYDLMLYADWVTLSFVKMSWSTGKAARKEQVAAIDKKLRRYHGLDWVADYGKKSRLIVEMLREVRDHLTHKADSRRGNAVLILGHQLMRVFENLGFYEDLNQAELDKMDRELRVAAEQPPRQLSEQDIMVGKIMILMRLDTRHRDTPEFRLAIDATREYAKFMAGMQSDVKDEFGHLLITKENLIDNSMPRAIVTDASFDSARVSVKIES